jgi:NAD(P)-dependent dehydrogenase (short-subunit alcohol dehydrogenase family)
MEGLTRALGVELALLRVNIVCPGLVKTPMWDGMSPADREAFYQSSPSRLLLRHVAEADEVAETCLHRMQSRRSTRSISRARYSL